MNELSQLADMAEILGAAIVIVGVLFAIIQMRQLRQQRREMAAIELFRFFGNPKFANAYQSVLAMPDSLDRADLRARETGSEQCAMLISTTMENIGVMVYHRIVPSIVVKNLMGTSTTILWGKLSIWIQDMRDELDNPAMFEWFQWLAMILEEMESDAVPAYESFRDWRPSRGTHEI